MMGSKDLRPAACLCLALVSPACGRGLNGSECQELLEHYTDKVIDQSRPSASATERARLIEQAVDKAAQDPEFLACPNRVSRSQFDCAMQARSADQVERCLL